MGENVVLTRLKMGAEECNVGGYNVNEDRRWCWAVVSNTINLLFHKLADISLVAE
jgi:hypothetical protein